MKKYLFILIFLVMGAEGQAQVLISLLLGDKLNTGQIEFGLEGGYNWSKIGGMDSDKYYSKWNLGFYFDIRIKHSWYINTGVLVKSNLGTGNLSENDLAFLKADTYDAEGEYSQVTSDFLVPILIKYRFRSNFFIIAGPHFGLLYNGWVEFNSDADGKEATIKEYNRDMFRYIDAGAMVGFGYKLHHKNDHGMSFAFKYYYGFVNVYKDRSGTNNSAMFLTMTIPIGANKNIEDID